MAGKPRWIIPKTPPEWLLLMRDDQGVNSKEVANLFSISLNAIVKAVQNDNFPKPDFKHSQIAASSHKFVFQKKSGAVVNKNYWKKSTIMEEINRRNLLESVNAK